jgi:hypothetical protein
MPVRHTLAHALATNANSQQVSRRVRVEDAH